MAHFRVYQFDESDGLPFQGIKLYHYAAGTTTDKDIWIDEGETTPLSQPHQGDSRGVIWFYGTGMYRLRFVTNEGILLYDWDNVEITETTVNVANCNDCDEGHVLKFVGPECDDWECGFVDLNDNTEGILSCAKGGTGNTCPTENGQVLIGNSVTGTWAKTHLTAGQGITLNEGPGTIEISAEAGETQTAFSSIALVAFNNASTPETQIDATAAVVSLKSTTLSTVITRTDVGTITNDISVAAAANGRDQAAAFPAGSWIHLYFIWNGTAVATITSLAIQTVGPTLPTGYTHWCYAAAFKLDAASALLDMRAIGSWSYYQEYQSVLVDGNSATEAIVTLAGFVPPNALATRIWSAIEESGANPGIGHLRWATGVDYVTNRGGGNGEPEAISTVMPNVGQQLFYMVTDGGGSAKVMNIRVQGFQVPNGGG